MALDDLVCEVRALRADMNGRLTALDGRLTALDGKVTALDGKVTALDGKVTALDGKVTALDGKVTGVDAEVVALRDDTATLNAKVTILMAKAANAQAARADALMVVPKADGQLPQATYPRNPMELMVAGNEKLPDGSANSWNKRRCMALLREYGEVCESETDDEGSEAARSARLKLCRRLGVTRVQLNMASLAL